jgi:hypothetical protein
MTPRGVCVASGISNGAASSLRGFLNRPGAARMVALPHTEKNTHA